MTEINTATGLEINMPLMHAVGRCGCLAALYYELERHLAGHTTAEMFAAEAAELMARHWDEM